MRDRPFEAVIVDMDGVVTRTAALHERAWQRAFDELLAARGERPFSSADYRAHVDGKPRYDGAADFLAARKIALPRGTPADPPEARTVCGLCNRKNAYLVELLDREGVEVFADTAAAIARWRRGELALALVSSSRNCRRVLEAAGLGSCFAVTVDGELAAALGLAGKREIMAEAARRLGVAPADAVILEDATAGVRAGREGGFGLVVGVARQGAGRELAEAGADQVTSDVARVRFPRRLPDALERAGELAAERGERPLAVFLDYDGTLSPIVADPRAAALPDDTRAVLAALAARFPVAILSGRDREDVAARVGLAGLTYAGNHGFDIAGPGQRRVHPEAAAAVGEIDRAERELVQRLGRLAGVVIERKRYSVAVHVRQVDSPATVAQVERTVAAIRERTGLRRRDGKKVFELEPATAWDKGRALAWLVDVLQARTGARPFVLYAGDDETDEDAFAVLRGDGLGVRVGEPVAASLADYQVPDPGRLRSLLRALLRGGCGAHHEVTTDPGAVC